MSNADYSLEEKWIGHWDRTDQTNLKKIYQKVVIINNYQNTVEQYPHNIFNIYKIIDYRANIKRASYFRVLPYLPVDINYRIGIVVSTTNVSIISPSTENNGYQIFVNMEYTCTDH